MEKPDRRDTEIEQLNKKIERYQQALTSLKTGKATADIHLKRRMGKVEKSVEQINEQLTEMAGLLDEGLTILTNGVKKLDEKYNELSTQQDSDSGAGGETLYHQHQQPSDLSSSAGAETPSPIQNSSVPSFQFLKRMAIKEPPTDPTPKRLDQKRYHPPSHTNYIKAITPGKVLQPLDEETELSKFPQQQEELPIEKDMKLVKPIASTIDETTASREQYSEIVDQVKVESDERTSNSQLWNMFKRK